jgi:hypothetical protein
MRIYITHCSATKLESARRTGKSVPPDALYTSQRAQRFMRRCRERRVRWAIFSDQYGVWFPTEKRRWYEKSPDRVTEAEFRRLAANFDRRLGRFREIRFYYHPGRFHRLYRRLLRAARLRPRVRLFRHLAEIG